jgi:hypothetical protein
MIEHRTHLDFRFCNLQCPLSLSCSLSHIADGLYIVANVSQRSHFDKGIRAPTATLSWVTSYNLHRSAVLVEDDVSTSN